MGDISAEPSMEDILSSIKRIIAEEGEAAPVRARRAGRPAPLPQHDEAPYDDRVDAAEVLELNDPIANAEATVDEEPIAMPVEPARATRASERPAQGSASAPASSGPAAAPVAPILSQQAATATRGSLEALSRMMVKPDAGSDGTLEGMVREMLRPMLAEWLDAKLPPMVEGMVAAEIARITGQQG